jgi:hypothetical protein
MLQTHVSVARLEVSGYCGQKNADTDPNGSIVSTGTG